MYRLQNSPIWLFAQDIMERESDQTLVKERLIFFIVKMTEGSKWVQINIFRKEGKIMKQAILFVFLLTLCLTVTPALVIAEEGASHKPVVETGQVNAGVVVPQEQDVGFKDTEENQIPDPRVVHKFTDDRILAIESEAQEEIKAIVEEINQLEDKSDEGELQKEIERIKLDAEIARLRITMEIAEEGEDFDLAETIADEIYRLENPEEPVVVEPSEQASFISR